jgi:hypothetical protein
MARIKLAQQYYIIGHTLRYTIALFFMYITIQYSSEYNYRYKRVYQNVSRLAL